MKTILLLSKKLGVSILLYFIPLLFILLSLYLVKQVSDDKAANAASSGSPEVLVDN